MNNEALEIEEINEDISTPRSVLNYPYIYLNEVKDELGLIVPLLLPGPLQIVLTMNNTTREIGTVEKSVIELNKLLRICKFDVVVDKHMRYKISSLADIFELPSNVWTA